MTDPISQLQTADKILQNRPISESEFRKLAQNVEKQYRNKMYDQKDIAETIAGAQSVLPKFIAINQKVDGKNNLFWSTDKHFGACAEIVFSMQDKIKPNLQQKYQKADEILNTLKEKHPKQIDLVKALDMYKSKILLEAENVVLMNDKINKNQDSMAEASRIKKTIAETNKLEELINEGLSKLKINNKLAALDNKDFESLLKFAENILPDNGSNFVPNLTAKNIKTIC